MKDLDVESSIRAVFALSSDVSKLYIHGIPYFYFKTDRKGDIRVVKYILKQNGIDAEAHSTHYYSNNEATDRIVRFSGSELDRCSIPNFKEQFEISYKNKADLYAFGTIDKKHSPVFFGFWSKAKKVKFINNIADRTR